MPATQIRPGPLWAAPLLRVTGAVLVVLALVSHRWFVDDYRWGLGRYGDETQTYVLVAIGGLTVALGLLSFAVPRVSGAAVVAALAGILAATWFVIESVDSEPRMHLHLDLAYPLALAGMVLVAVGGVLPERVPGPAGPVARGAVPVEDPAAAARLDRDLAATPDD